MNNLVLLLSNGFITYAYETIDEIRKCIDESILENECNIAYNVILLIRMIHDEIFQFNAPMIDLQKNKILRSYLKYGLRGIEIDFGKYIQTNGSQEFTSIRWKVLNYNDNKLLLLSTKVLDVLDVQSSEIYLEKWSKSQLRKYANTYFLEGAFSEDERELICEEPICFDSNKKNGEFKESKLNVCKDRVFLINEDTIHMLYEFRFSDVRYTEFASTKEDENQQNRGLWYLFKEEGAEYQYNTEDKMIKFEFRPAIIIKCCYASPSLT